MNEPTPLVTKFAKYLTAIRAHERLCVTNARPTDEERKTYLKQLREAEEDFGNELLNAPREQIEALGLMLKEGKR